MADDGSDKLRVLFCIGVMPAFFEAGPDGRQEAFEAIPAAFKDLKGRFGIDVAATFDDDRLAVGAPPAGAWTAYIVADAPSLDAAIAVCDVLRQTDLPSGAKLWKYLRIEARVGRPLFFGNA